MALVILTIASAGLLLPFASSAAVQEEGSRRTLATTLGCDLMETIVGTDYDEIVAAYGVYTESSGYMKDGRGFAFSGFMYEGFSRKAFCDYVYVPQQDGLGSPNFIRIIVKVYYNDSEIAEFTRLKSQ